MSEPKLIRYLTSSKYRVLGISYKGKKLLVTTSGVFKDKHESEVWDARTGKRLHVSPGAETLVEHCRQGKKTWFPMEHGTQRSVRYAKGKFRDRGRNSGRWSIAAHLWEYYDVVSAKSKTIPVTGVNDDWPFGSKGFLDHSRITDMRNGDVLATIPVAGFPSSLVQHRGSNMESDLYASLFFCREATNVGIWRPDGWNLLGDYGMLCSDGRAIWAGGGLFRQWYAEGHENGKLYRINTTKRRVKVKLDTGSKRCVQNIYDGKDYLYSAWAEPFQVYRVDTRKPFTSERLFYDHAQINVDSGHSFGMSIALDKKATRLAIALTKGSTPAIYELTL